MQTIAVMGKFALMARLGYAARAVVYLMIGALAVMAATGANGGEATGSKGALAQLAAQPFGDTLLALVAIGLVCYSAWRVTQAFGNAETHEWQGKGKVVAKRVAWLVSALLHLALAYWAFQVVFGTSSGSDSGDWTARLMGTEYGIWIVGAAGVGAIIAGLNMIYRGWKAKFEQFMSVPYDKQRVIYPICRFGLAARGVVFIIIGAFLIQAARNYSAEEIGIGKALEAVQQQAYGQWLLGLVGLGLIAFAVYSATEAVYRRIAR